jgi:hypothetical protein
MDEDLKKELIFFIINELKKLQSDMLIEQALHNNNKNDEEENPNNIFDLFKLLKDDLKNDLKFSNKIHFNTGMFEAYSNILSKLDSRLD